jgi:phosphonate transport system ATP-binding protein
MDISGVSEVLSSVQLSEKIFNLCDQLSGGQLQRVGIARALYQQSELILADEPVSALDPGLAFAMIQVLKQDAMSRGATLITSLHAVDLALQCFDRIVGLRDGKMVFDLPAHQVTPAMLKDLYANESQINTAPYKPGSDIADTVAARLV